MPSFHVFVPFWWILHLVDVRCVCVCASVWYLKGGFADLQLELIKLLIFCQLSLDIEGYDDGITTFGLIRQHDNYCRYDSNIMFVEKLFERKAFLVNQLWILRSLASFCL